MGKRKREIQEDDEANVEKIKSKEEPETEEYKESYEEKVKNATVIAKPMASKKLAKKCYKLIKSAKNHKTYLRNGLKDVQTRIRKGETGIVVFAGDVRPIDIMCHMPIVCEEKDIPYCYVPSRLDLGAALGMKRSTIMVLIREHDEYKDSFNEIKEEMKHLAVSL